MRVKKILVNDVSIVMDLLIRELIKEEISYVKVDNEIHFEDSIYRFYNIEEKELIKSEDDKRIELLLNTIKEDKTLFVPLLNTNDKYFKSHFTPIQNKQLIKRQNRNNNKLVNTSKK